MSNPLALLRAAAGSLRILWAVDRRLTVAGLACSFLQAAAFPALLFVIGRVLEALVSGKSGGGVLGSPTELVGALAAILVFQQCVAVLGDMTSAVLRAEVLRSINERLIAKLSEVPFARLDSNEFQASYGFVVEEAALKPGMVVDGMLGLAVAAVGFLGVLATLAVEAPVVLLVLAAVLALALVEVRYRVKMVELQTSSAGDLFRASYLSYMAINPLWQRDLRFRRSSLLADSYGSLMNGYIARLRRLVRRFSVMRVVAAVLSVGLFCAAILLTVHLRRTGSVSAREASVLLPALIVAFSLGRGVASALAIVTEGVQYTARVLAFFDEPAVSEPSLARRGRASSPSVALEHVSFSYEPGGPLVLDDVSCEFSCGVTVVVGPNGAGKSTLLKILGGLYQPARGRILLASGGGAAEAPVGAVFQEPSHLQFSVGQNVTLSWQVDEPERVAETVQRVGLGRALAALPDGLDTLIGDGYCSETTLSGGQWQRLALARMLHSPSPILLLDEPVASLDPEGEREFFDAVRELATDRVVILTTHRLDTIDPSDRVVMLVDGVVVEDGTKSALVAARGEYSAFARR